MASASLFTKMHEPSFFIDSVKLEVIKIDVEDLNGILPLHLLKSQAGISVPRGVLEDVLLCLQPQLQVELLQHSHEKVCEDCAGI